MNFDDTELRKLGFRPVQFGPARNRRYECGVGRDQWSVDFAAYEKPPFTAYVMAPSRLRPIFGETWVRMELDELVPYLRAALSYDACNSLTPK